MSDAILRTPRLLARPFRAQDWPVIHAVQSDPARGYWVRGPHVAASESRSRAAAERVEADWKNGWGIYHLSRDGQPIGYAGLRASHLEDTEEIEALWGLLPTARGVGHASEAMRAILNRPLPRGARSLASWALPGNWPSRRLMERLGFVFERETVHVALPHVVYRWRP